MKFTCEIEMNNAAFEDNPDAELSRLLRELSKKLIRGMVCNKGNLRDANGNTVGTWSVNDGP